MEFRRVLVRSITGDDSGALRGLGKIEDTAEAGGYVGYQSGNFAAKLDVRQALSGGQGLIATLGLHYVADISLSPTSNGEPIKIAIRPRLNHVHASSDARRRGERGGSTGRF